MDSKIYLNEYIEADVISDILSQNIAKARQKVAEKNTEESKAFLEKLLYYQEETKKGNKEIIKKILEGDI